MLKFFLRFWLCFTIAAGIISIIILILILIPHPTSHIQTQYFLLEASLAAGLGHALLGKLSMTQYDSSQHRKIDALPTSLRHFPGLGHFLEPATRRRRRLCVLVHLQDERCRWAPLSSSGLLIHSHFVSGMMLPYHINIYVLMIFNA